jgi:hypothetical protein
MSIDGCLGVLRRVYLLYVYCIYRVSEEERRYCGQERQAGRRRASNEQNDRDRLLADNRTRRTLDIGHHAVMRSMIRGRR